MIVFLRSIGFLNAAIWFGAVVLFTFGTTPALSSPEMKTLLGPRNFPYFSGAVGNVIATQFFHLQLVCGLVAVLHLMAEWLYFGKVPSRFWRGVLGGMLAFVLISGAWLQPRIHRLNGLRFAPNATVERREAAARSYRVWVVIHRGVNILLAAAAGAYLWRIANPPDPTRFVSAVKFRS